MKVHLIKLNTVENYIVNHAAGRASFNEWLTKIKAANWEKPGDIIRSFGSADLLGNGCERVIFNIGGNNYRMIAKYVFGVRNVHLYVKWIGTHAEYNLICARNEQYEIDEN